MLKKSKAMHNKLFIANWKMQMSLAQTDDFCHSNQDSFLALSKSATLVLCPSFTSLHAVKKCFADNTLFLGAQNCSMFATGAYTGQESALSLSQAGCSYCIIGHSECRQYLHESNQDIATKTMRLLEHDIIPIICIGELLQEYQQGKTLSVLQAQLGPIFTILTTYPKIHKLCIAYEPVWAIGTGEVPSLNHLKTVFDWLAKTCVQNLPSTTSYTLLYGGSVSLEYLPTLQQISAIQGLLIGGASLDFQKFQKIVSLF